MKLLTSIRNSFSRKILSPAHHLTWARASRSEVQTDSTTVRLVAPPDASQVVVTFENAADFVNRDNKDRPGFGEKLLVNNGYAVLSVLAHKVHWYRLSEAQDLITSSQVENKLSGFDVRHGYGSSMGAFAAMAFGDVLSLTNIVAMNPVTTLREDRAPWEKRFKAGKRYDWNTAYSDAVDHLKCAERLWAFYDPDETDRDATHVDRLRPVLADRLIGLPLPGASHAVPRRLLQRGLLTKVVLASLAESEPTRVKEMLAPFAQFTNLEATSKN